ncbi:MAG: response regulator [Alphaproteobacteria bacterium]
MSGPLSGVKMVVIETDVNMRNMIMKILRDVGADRVEMFPGISNALPFLRDNEVDLIICQMEQSPIDGTGLAHAMRAGKVKANIRTPLILVAIDNDMAKIKDAITAGANNIVLKPFSANEMVKRVRKTLSAAITSK